ncbi:magnesium chelatase subunit ChlI family protein [Rossellomorea arthrocnemi]|uniref:magnesium chelatase subunit ChlI family protein n=1 Tax=Rossellomorea arthrocnemi TaxID=2769542 RepID=UPI00191A8D55|nr:hypothetical protein [Rossellomorea arthrocnemi]
MKYHWKSIHLPNQIKGRFFSSFISKCSFISVISLMRTWVLNQAANEKITARIRATVIKTVIGFTSIQSSFFMMQVKVIRLARTIADLDDSVKVTEQHMWEAVKLHRRPPSEKHHGARVIGEPLT